MIERSERDIINKFKEYKDQPEAMQAMAEILVFLGLPEGVDFWQMAQEEIKAEAAANSELRSAYRRHIAQGFKNYMSYEKFVQKKEAGEL
jgi:formylmethanofuran dehydrogenase subunit A